MPHDSHFYFHNTDEDARLTQHARERMHTRRLSTMAIQAAFDYGREVHTRGATFHVIGRKEVQRWRRRDIDISKFEGVHVVCSTNGRVMTVYRNQDLRGLRPRRRYQGRRS